jgi:hypothetical protein
LATCKDDNRTIIAILIYQSENYLIIQPRHFYFAILRFRLFCLLTVFHSFHIMLNKKLTYICLQLLAFVYKTVYNKYKECDIHGKYNSSLCKN